MWGTLQESAWVVSYFRRLPKAIEFELTSNVVFIISHFRWVDYRRRSLRLDQVPQGSFCPRLVSSISPFQVPSNLSFFLLYYRSTQAVPSLFCPLPDATRPTFSARCTNTFWRRSPRTARGCRLGPSPRESFEEGKEEKGRSLDSYILRPNSILDYTGCSVKRRGLRSRPRKPNDQHHHPPLRPRHHTSATAPRCPYRKASYPSPFPRN